MSAKKPPPVAAAVEKNNKNDADVDEQQEEDMLLASVHASLHDHSAYESRVLRQATHQLAPPLSADTLGFPNLVEAGLVAMDESGGGETSSSSSSSVLVIRAVLAETRRKIRESSARMTDGAAISSSSSLDLLHMKEQILLNYLSTTIGGADGADLPVRPHEERAAEQARSRQLVEGTNRTKQPPDINNKDPQTKNNHQHGSNGQQHKRVPMMKRKRIENNAEDDDDDDEKKNSAVVSKEELAKLKLLRQERRQRREQRRQQFVESSSSSSSSEEEFEDDGKDGDEEADGKDVEDVVDDSSDIGGDVHDDDDEVNNDGASLEEDLLQKTAVVCPLCQQQVAVPAGLSSSGGSVDAVLSQHMALCQNQRRSSRRSTAAARNNDSKNHMVGDMDNDPALSTQPRASLKRSAAASKTTKRSAVKPPKKKRANHLQKPYYSAVDDIDESVYEDRVDDWIENGLSRMKIMKERDDSESLPGAEEYQGGLLIPEWMNNRLFGYQREGLKWMWESHQQLVGGVIGDEMGLGKTVQAAAFLGAAAASRKLKSVLIVAPATMLQHWLSELAVWAPGLRRVLIHTSGGEVDGLNRSISSQLLRKLSIWLKRARADRVNEPIDDEDWKTLDPHSFCGTGYAIVTTYENLRRNADVYTSHDFSYVLLDEAQKIKSPDADITIVCKRIRTPHRLAISGTPVQNDLRELWSLFDFVFPGRLGTLPAFEQEFAVPIKRGGYSNASPMQVQLAYRCALMLRDLIEPFMLRRLKKDVKEVSRMPGKTEHVLFCRLSQRQRDMYEAYLKSEDVSRVIRGNNQLLGALTMLRKISNHPDLVCDPSEASFQSFIQNGGSQMKPLGEDSDDDSEEEILDEESLMQRSGKLEVLSKVLPLWHKQGHRVLIFCQWRKMLNIIQRFVMLKGWKFARLDGNTNIASRQHLVDSFNNDDSYFGMLCTTRTGGVGLNLTGANRILIYDPDFNPSADAQARERSWRFGQEKEVTIYRLITAGTIEEKIYQRQIFKTALSNKVLQDPKQRRLFSQRDLRDLFTLGDDNGSVRSGGDGITDTSKVTRGVGVVDAETDLSEDRENDDNVATLKKVMNSKGLAGVFDHHSVEFDSKRKSTTVREMEEHAKRVSKEAVEALKESVSTSDPFTPTWTGSNETKPSRFGPSTTADDVGLVPVRSFTPSVSAGPMSSSSLLASLRNRTTAIETDGKTEPDKQYTGLLARLKEFVRQYRPSTDEILKEFSNIPDAEVAVFRGLLKSVARIKNGRWYVLKE